MYVYQSSTDETEVLLEKNKKRSKFKDKMI